MSLRNSFFRSVFYATSYLFSHVVFAPCAHNAYAGSSFPGLVDALYSVQQLNSKDWELVEKELSVAVFYIQSATNVMTLKSI